MRPRFRRLQRGSLTVFMVGAVFAMILAIGLGVDGSRALQGFLRASGEAQEAARTGADVLDVASVYGGSTPTVDPTGGACAAAAAVHRADRRRHGELHAERGRRGSADRERLGPGADDLPWALRCQQLHDEGLGHRPGHRGDMTMGVLRRIAGAITSLAGVAVLLLLIAGVPLMLVLLVGWPLPHTLPSWNQITMTFQTQGIDMGVLLRVLACVLWVLWAYLMVGMLVELVATLRGLQGRRRPWVAPGQRLAALLVGVVMLGIALMSRPAASTRPVSLSAALTPRTAVVALYDPPPHPAPAASTPRSSPARPRQRQIKTSRSSLATLCGRSRGRSTATPRSGPRYGVRTRARWRTTARRSRTPASSTPVGS